MQQNNQTEIILVKHSAIDKERWDGVISGAPNSRVYAASWYLDRVADNWDALIYGDYDYVMPVTWRRKWGITYLYQPLFCQQLGIFPPPKKTIQEQFFSRLYQLFRYAGIQVNAHMESDAFPGFSCTGRRNYILPLLDSYSGLKAGFSKHTNRNIAKAKKYKISVVKGLQTREFVQQKQAALDTDRKDASFALLENIISYCQVQGNGILLGAYTRENLLCAGAFFLRFGSRVTYLSAFSLSEGKESSAMFAIVDHFIREHAGSGLLLDFEGSSIQGIERFYKGFGSSLETYYQLRLNRLMFPFNRLK
jgi:hypothetical protein